MEDKNEKERSMVHLRWFYSYNKELYDVLNEIRVISRKTKKGSHNFQILKIMIYDEIMSNPTNKSRIPTEIFPSNKRKIIMELE